MESCNNTLEGPLRSKTPDNGGYQLIMDSFENYQFNSTPKQDYPYIPNKNFNYTMMQTSQDAVVEIPGSDPNFSFTNNMYSRYFRDNSTYRDPAESFAVEEATGNQNEIIQYISPVRDKFSESDKSITSEEYYESSERSFSCSKNTTGSTDSKGRRRYYQRLYPRFHSHYVEKYEREHLPFIQDLNNALGTVIDEEEYSEISISKNDLGSQSSELLKCKENKFPQHCHGTKYASWILDVEILSKIVQYYHAKGLEHNNSPKITTSALLLQLHTIRVAFPIHRPYSPVVMYGKFIIERILGQGTYSRVVQCRFLPDLDRLEIAKNCLSLKISPFLSASFPFPVVKSNYSDKDHINMIICDAAISMAGISNLTKNDVENRLNDSDESRSLGKHILSQKLAVKVFRRETRYRNACWDEWIMWQTLLGVVQHRSSRASTNYSAYMLKFSDDNIYLKCFTESIGSSDRGYQFPAYLGSSSHLDNRKCWHLAPQLRFFPPYLSSNPPLISYKYSRHTPAPNTTHSSGKNQGSRNSDTRRFIPRSFCLQSSSQHIGQNEYRQSTGSTSFITHSVREMSDIYCFNAPLEYIPDPIHSALVFQLRGPSVYEVLGRVKSELKGFLKRSSDVFCDGEISDSPSQEYNQKEEKSTKRKNSQDYNQFFEGSKEMCSTDREDGPGDRTKIRSETNNGKRVDSKNTSQLSSHRAEQNIPPEIIRRLNEHRAFPLSFIRIVMFQVLIFLHHAHQLGLVHTDIKPENILCDCHPNDISCEVHSGDTNNLLPDSLIASEFGPYSAFVFDSLFESCENHFPSNSESRLDSSPIQTLRNEQVKHPARPFPRNLGVKVSDVGGAQLVSQFSYHSVYFESMNSAMEIVKPRLARIPSKWRRKHSPVKDIYSDTSENQFSNLAALSSSISSKLNRTSRSQGNHLNRSASHERFASSPPGPYTSVPLYQKSQHNDNSCGTLSNDGKGGASSLGLGDMLGRWLLPFLHTSSSSDHLYNQFVSPGSNPHSENSSLQKHRATEEENRQEVSDANEEVNECDLESHYPTAPVLVSMPMGKGIIQTLHYRAPEVLLKTGWSTPSDLFSLGVMVPELYYGETIFEPRSFGFDLEFDELVWVHLASMDSVLGPMPERFLGRIPWRSQLSPKALSLYFNVQEEQGFQQSKYPWDNFEYCLSPASASYLSSLNEEIIQFFDLNYNQSSGYGKILVPIIDLARTALSTDTLDALSHSPADNKNFMNLRNMNTDKMDLCTHCCRQHRSGTPSTLNCSHPPGKIAKTEDIMTSRTEERESSEKRHYNNYVINLDENELISDIAEDSDLRNRKSHESSPKINSKESIHLLGIQDYIARPYRISSLNWPPTKLSKAFSCERDTKAYREKNSLVKKKVRDVAALATLGMRCLYQTINRVMTLYLAEINEYSAQVSSTYDSDEYADDYEEYTSQYSTDRDYYTESGGSLSDVDIEHHQAGKKAISQQRITKKPTSDFPDLSTRFKENKNKNLPFYKSQNSQNSLATQKDLGINAHKDENILKDSERSLPDIVPPNLVTTDNLMRKMLQLFGHKIFKKLTWAGIYLPLPIAVCYLQCAKSKGAVWSGFWTLCSNHAEEICDLWLDKKKKASSNQDSTNNSTDGHLANIPPLATDGIFECLENSYLDDFSKSDKNVSPQRTMSDQIFSNSFISHLSMVEGPQFPEDFLPILCALRFPEILFFGECQNSCLKSPKLSQLKNEFSCTGEELFLAAGSPLFTLPESIWDLFDEELLFWDLSRQLTLYDPFERLTAGEALLHPFFDPLRKEKK